MNDIKQHKYYYRSWQKIIDDQLCYNEQYKSNGECMIDPFEKMNLGFKAGAKAILDCFPTLIDHNQHYLNQQATANHTAKMFNQFRTTRPKQRIENSEYAEIIALDPKYEWKKDKETKMTRKEAIGKLIDIYRKEMPRTMSEDYAERRIKELEALGLIKFDEEKSVVDEAKEYVRNYTLYDRQELAGVIDMLIRHIEK